MTNPLLGQVLGSVFASAMRGRANAGPFGAGAGVGGGLDNLGRGLGGGLGGAALGGLLGGLMRRPGAAGNGTPAAGGRHRGLLLALLLPFAMQWVQRNGGIAAVLDRFRQHGFGPQADSWVSHGQNQPLAAEAVDNVVGREELSRLARQLGVGEDEVKQGFAEILPEMADQLSPQGQVPPEADEALHGGLSEMQKALAEVQPDVQLS